MDQIAELLDENQEDEDHDNDREHIDNVMMPPDELDGVIQLKVTLHWQVSILSLRRFYWVELRL